MEKGAIISGFLLSFFLAMLLAGIIILISDTDAETSYYYYGTIALTHNEYNEFKVAVADKSINFTPSQLTVFDSGNKVLICLQRLHATEDFGYGNQEVERQKKSNSIARTMECWFLTIACIGIVVSAPAFAALIGD